MKKLILLIAIFFSCSIESASKPYYLSICAVFNNETSILKEWIEYHRLIGVQHFYLYNNNSQDDYKKVLKPYIEQGIVELTDWPSPANKNWTYFQSLAYCDCIKKCKKKTKWLAVIELDEFIVPTTEDSLVTFLKSYEPFGGVKIYWQNFGTSHLPLIPEGKLHIESLTLKYPWDHEINESAKCIVQPSRVSSYSVHHATYKNGYFAVTPNKKDAARQGLQIDKIRINHYWTRAEDFFFEVKVPRLHLSGRPVTQEQIDEILAESNQVEDTLIFKYVERLQERMDF